VEENDRPRWTRFKSGQTAQEKRIFISYRRSDCQPQANAINDGLRHRLQPARVFMDIDSIPAGVDFAEHIREEIEMCDYVLVLIGDNWLSATDNEGRRRIDNPDDFVRLEIENAFTAAGVTVVPVLVEGAEMPRATDLPEGLQRLSRINAIELSDQRWSSDIERLANEIKRIEAHQQERANRAREQQEREAAEAATATAAAAVAAEEGAANLPEPDGAPEVETATIHRLRRSMVDGASRIWDARRNKE